MTARQIAIIAMIATAFSLPFIVAAAVVALEVAGR